MAIPTAIHERNLERLRAVHHDLWSVAIAVMEHIPTVVVFGWRGEKEQTEAFITGHSEKPWPTSKHNAMKDGRPLSLAVDMMPHPVNWEDREQLTLFAGFVMGLATQKGIKLRYGGDWNQNWQVSDNILDDLVHFELVSAKT